LLACAFPGVQDNTPVTKLKGLLFQHGLATRLVCPEPGLWKVPEPGVGRGRVGAATRPPPTMSCGFVVCADGRRWVWGLSQSGGRFVYTTGSARGVGNTPCAGTTRPA
jgi:hypothetical protein